MPIFQNNNPSPLTKFSSIGLGTWMMERDPEASKRALIRGLEEGANHIDTAEMYGDGKAEEIVGEAVRGRREGVYLVSKVLPSHAGYEAALAACERSLRRLKTDYLDIYLLHWRERRTPLEETFRAFEKLKSDGKIRSWGVSNFDVRDMEQSVRLVGEGKIVCNQVLYHLKQRAIESRLIPWCRDHGIRVVAYSPLGQGELPRHPVLDQIAEHHGATTAQVALAFLTRDPLVIAIPKSADLERTKENVRAMKLRLLEKDLQQFDRAFPLKSCRILPMI